MRKGTVVLDADGVLTNIAPNAISYIGQKYNVVVTEDDITGWDWGYNLGLPEADDDIFWNHIWENPAEIYPNALDFIESIRELGFHIVIVSNRPEDISKEAAHRDFAIFKSQYVLVNSNPEKVDIINNINPDVKFVVEDNPKNAMRIGHSTNAHTMLLSRPWNQNCISITNAYQRVHNYDHIMGILETYEE